MAARSMGRRLLSLLVVLGCAHSPERQAVREGCLPFVISCLDEPHGCYLPMGLVPGDVESSCVTRDAWSSFFASAEAENLWKTAASRPDTIRCSWAGPFGSETWALIVLEQVQQGAFGILRRADGSGLTSRGQVRLAQEDWVALFKSAVETTTRILPVRDFDVIGHAGTVSLLVEVIAAGSYAALELDIPEEERSGQELISLCAALPGAASILKEVRSAPLVPSRPSRRRPTSTDGATQGYRVVL